MRLIIKNLILGVLLVQLLCMCNKQSDVYVQLNTSDISDNTLLSQNFRLKEIIVLDTVPEAYCNTDKINNFLFIENKIIISDYASPNINVFDRTTGKLVRSINRAGRGPEEYSHNKRIVLQDNKSIIAENYSGYLNFYNVNGDYLKQTSAPVAKNQMNEIMITSDGNFLISRELVGLYTHTGNLNPYYSAMLVSEAGLELKGSIERPTNIPKLLIKSISSTFYKYDSDIYLSPLTENSIYKYSTQDSVFIPLIKFIIDGIDVETELLKENFDPVSFLNKYDRLYIQAITKSFYIVSLNNTSKNRKLYLVINKNNNKVNTFINDGSIDMLRGRFVRNSEGYLVQIITYHDMVNESEELIDSELVRLINSKTEISERTNAILCIYEEL